MRARVVNNMSNEMEHEKKPIDVENVVNKRYGFGVRHLQMISLFLIHVALIISRNNMGVVVLAMTDVNKRNNTDIVDRVSKKISIKYPKDERQRITEVQGTNAVRAAKFKLESTYWKEQQYRGFTEIYDWDKKTQGLIQSSFFWGYIVMQIPGGLLAKRYGAKPILMIALLANSIISLLLPTLTKLGGWIMVCVCRVLMGLTQSCLYPASHTLLGRWLPSNERTTYTGFVYSGYQIGTIIGMPITGMLSETKLGWQLVFYGTSALLLICAVIWHFLSASTPSQHRMISQEEKNYIEDRLCHVEKVQSISSMPWSYIIRSKPLWAILVVHVSAGIVIVLFLVEIPTYMERVLHTSLKSTASLSGFSYVGMWVGNIVSSFLCDKIYSRGLLSISTCRKLFNSLAFFGAAISLITLSFMGYEQKHLIVSILVIALTMIGFCSAGYMVNHLDLSPNYAGVLLSITNFSCSIGNILTPIVTSYILSAEPSNIRLWRIIFLTAAVICIISNIIYIVCGSGERQKWDEINFQDKEKANEEEMKSVFS